MGMFLRRGPAEKPVHGLNVIISGDMDSSYAYATINETRYTEPGTYVFPKGTSITVFCKCQVYLLFGDSGSKITLNGEIVQEATKSGTIQFNFSLSGETTINFFTKTIDNSKNYSCDITTG